MIPFYEDADNGITIWHADCLEKMAEFASSECDMILTDPPYGVNWISKGGEVRPLANDTPAYDIYIREAFAEFLRLIRPGDLAAIFCSGKNAVQEAKWVLSLYEVGFGVDAKVIWEKGLKMGARYRSCYETILVGARPGANPRWYNDKSQRNIIKHPSVIAKPDGHPTPKPVPLVEYLMRNHTEVGDLVLDPFMGEGTTLLAALNLGRRAVGIEIEERWCERAARRLETARASRR